jgi:energy-coupling factor transporter ATP-binding protein EcfA2
LQDSHTARFLFDRLLRGPLLANRTIILVTHHVELVLPAAKYIVRMLDGRVDTHGTPASLRSRGVLAEITASESVKEDKEPIPAEAAAEGGKAGVAVAEAEEVAKQTDSAKKPRKLVDDEHREEGAVKWSIYNTYLKAS